jgi:alpha-amylase
MRRVTPIPSPLLLLLALGCAREPAQNTPATVALTVPSWATDAAIYEVNVRQFTPEGTFAALERHIPRLDSLGVDMLWLMPVQPVGIANRKGRLGSYYSIRDYRAVNPEFGTAADARRFISAAHAAGLRVVLDWVPNHTAFDHTWITAHPDWYTHRADGSISVARDNEGKETDWTDVADLDYGKADMRRQMISDMRWWVDSMNVDGFRVDVAWGVPLDFFADARRALTAVRPELFFLAEAEGPQYHADFHATYGWELHHLLGEVAQGKKGAKELDAYFAKQAAEYPRDAFRMTFTSNHDENSWQGTEFERMGANHLAAFVLATTSANAFPLLYTGQEVSMQKRLRFFDKDTVDWTGPSLADFYRRMFELKERNAALWNGAAGGPQVRLATTGGERVYAYTRTKDDNTVLVAVNFGDAAARVTWHGLSASGNYTDWFTRQTVALAGTGTLDVPAHGYRILVR